VPFDFGAKGFVRKASESVELEEDDREVGRRWEEDLGENRGEERLNTITTQYDAPHPFLETMKAKAKGRERVG
jgi:hypothetical protein